MSEYLNIGPSPSDEPAAQVGSDDYPERSRAETTTFKNQLLYPQPVDGCWHLRAVCVVEGELISTPDGQRVPIEQLPEACEVPSFTQATGAIRWAKACRVVSGPKECVEVTTRSGLCLRTSTEHLYMVPGFGYSRGCDLKPGGLVGTSTQHPGWTPSSDLSEADAHFLGLLIGDGNFTRNEVQFTSADKEMRGVLDRHAARFGAFVNHGRAIEYRIVGAENAGRKGPGNNRVLNWLRQLGLQGHLSHTKFVPREVMTATPKAVAAFLAGLLDTDGCVSLKGSVSWATSSRGLAESIQHLLGRFGVRSTLSTKLTNFQTLAYNVFVHGAAKFKLLYNILAEHLCLPRKVEGLKLLASKTPRRLASCRRKRDREGLGAHQEAGTELYWDKIAAIKFIGLRQCYNICIEDGQDSNFVGGLVGSQPSMFSEVTTTVSSII